MRPAALPALLWLALCAARPAQAQAAPPQLPPLPDPLAGGLPGAEHRVLDKIPLALALPVGRERIVAFPAPVRAGLPPALGGDALRVQVAGGTLYLTALRPFPAQRVQIQAQASGNVYLLDLSADKAAPANPVEVVLPGEPPRAQALPGAPGQPPAQAAPAAPPPPREQDYATLVRMAAQHVYGPERLRRLPEGVHPAPAGGGATALLLRGGAVEAEPLAAWRSGSLHVTAVKLQNRTGGALGLDPRRLRGDWLAAAFQHGSLDGLGGPRDTSAAYLVSARPYAEALNGR